MGLNNTYIITIEEENESKALEYILENCVIRENQLPNPLSAKDNCLSLKVKVDIPIKRYLRNYYRHGRFNSDYQEEKIENRIKDEYTNIGCVDIDVKRFNSKINLRFVCVSSSMSKLFTDSTSIRSWFNELCKATSAQTGIYDRENHYLELFWYKGQPKSFKIGEKIKNEIFCPNDPERPSLQIPIKELLNASFDYAYELERK
jgi:hypothetical protein